MVFTNLSSHEKDAFFGLLDEYFSSRPDLFSNVGSSEDPATGHGRAAAASAVQNAFSNTSPQEVASSFTTGWKRPSPNASSPNSPDVSATNSVGRVAAAAAAFGASNHSPGFSAPRPPPRPSPSLAGSHDDSEDQGPPPERSKLVPQKKFGDVDVSSGKSMFSSLRHSTANKTATPPQVAPPTPAAFPNRKNNFAPPPVRRAGSVVTTSTPPVNKAPSPPPPPRRPQQEEEGEWAEALYDYTSEDPGDLELQAGQRLVVLEKTSDDWWTGEIEGRRGLVPAAYVKVL
ncbi:hypothetical protein AcV7_007862 [Taiwanofungus camphoratus]|nr:hypothetical protein AcV7_007862 [Antrodia cinnamomea]